jgi:hypothetical protein
MTRTLETAQRGEGAPKRIPVALLVAVIAAIDAAFLFSLAAMLSWQGFVVVVLVTTVLAGGAVFTALEMRRLEKHGPD